MSVSLIKKILAATSVICIANPVLALDLDKTVTLPDAPVTLPVQEASGWYLRGDIGTTVQSLKKTPSFSTFSVANGARAGTVTSSSFKENSISGGVGVGYRFSDLLRADATVDVATGHVSGSGVGVDPCSGAPGGTTCSLSASGKFTNYSVMANAYMDLGTISRFTPYVGAGIGATQVNYSEFNGTGSCVGGGCGGAPDVNLQNPGLSQWRTTWALMAGVSYDISDRAKIDLGYRYSRIPGGKMFGYDSASVALGASGTQASDGGFDRHEIRAGIRIAGW